MNSRWDRESLICGPTASPASRLSRGKPRLLRSDEISDFRAAEGTTEMAIDPRFLAESGREVFTGNELLIKGALETDGGVHLLTGYPGSPVAGFFDVCGAIKDLLQTNGVRAFQAN